jgi:hypothetical protein
MHVSITPLHAGEVIEPLRLTEDVESYIKRSNGKRGRSKTRSKTDKKYFLK